MRLARLFAPLLVLASIAPAAAQQADLVSIVTPRGVAQSFILIEPEDPVAAVILLVGGHGALGLKSPTEMDWGERSFLVRTRGTWSAAWNAIAADNIDGLVLTSTITKPRPHWKLAQTHPDGVASLPLDEVALPTLILAHAEDTCDTTPPEGVSKLRDRLTNAQPLEVLMLKGGEPNPSEPCEALSRHGFLGIEDEAVGAIVKFIAANSAKEANGADDANRK
jgi:hypothetical protein